jgi:pimeloyl-ACP methyl ester carboxylesterase
MVYEDDQGQIQDILLAENHAQVLISMWEEPASTVLPRITCPTLIIPAGPNPKHAGAEFTKIREEMVEAATNALMDCRVHWIPETIHDIGYHKPEELARIIGRYIAEE